MTNYGDYEESLNDCVKSYRNAVKDNNAEIPQGFGMAFNYGYTFGMQQANAERKESAKRETDFQREHIATAAMQGLLASPTDSQVQWKDAKFIAKYAVECADALINELNKPKDENNN